MKKLFALLIALVLTIGLAAPAFAADMDDEAIYEAVISGEMGVGDAGWARGPVATMYDDSESYDAELSRITLGVKELLQLDTESYQDFNGYKNGNGPNTRWNLNWSNYDEADGSTRYLNISVDTEGKLLSYSFNQYNNSTSYYYNSKFSPKFLPHTRAEALEVASDFLANVLGEGETVEFDNKNGPEPISVSSFYFYGSLYMNGVKTPISINLNIDVQTLDVTYFSRSDDYNTYVAGYPSEVAAVSAEDALLAMQDGVSVELIYSLDWDSKVASPKYSIAVDSNAVVVDAQTGEIIDLNALYDAIYREGGLYSVSAGIAMNGMAMVDAEASMAYKQLSSAEISAVEKLEGVLDRATLEAAVRAIAELGLTDEFICTSMNYGQPYGEDEAKVDVSMAFSKSWAVETDDGVMRYNVYKHVSVNGKTGDFLYMWGSENLPADTAEVTFVDGEAFAASVYPEFALVSPYTHSYSQITPLSIDKAVPQSDFYYVQHVNDIPFTYNSISISYSKLDGSLLAVNKSWLEDEITFAPADDLISADEAKDIFMQSVTADLIYIQIPVALLPSEVRPLYRAYLDAGYSYVHEMKLVYSMNTKGIYEIDAVTGETNEVASYDYVAKSYTDLDASYAKEQILKLAEYGIGFEDTLFKPEEALTALDFAIFYLSAEGYNYSAESDEQWVIDAAVNRGLLKKGTDTARVMTRAEVIKNLISATEYGVAAVLENVWNTGFGDQSSIESDSVGHIAIARALGIVRGDERGNFNPNDSVTRQDAAIILYNFMSR